MRGVPVCAGPGVSPAGPGVAPAEPGVPLAGPGVAPAHLQVNLLADADPGNAVPRPVVYATKSLPPASTDFVSRVWNDFEGTVMPFLGDVAKQAVRTNRDPKDIGVFDSVTIQKEILNGTYSKYQFFILDLNLYGTGTYLEPNGTGTRYQR